MKNIMMMMVMLIAFLSGVLIAKESYKDSASEEFVKYGQYAPQYIGYTDSQMIKACSKYKLRYDIEQGVCYEE